VTDAKLKTPSPDRWHSISVPKRRPEDRICNFGEVALGYDEGQALVEASRCITCPNPKCVEGCPVELDIPGFIKLIKESKFEEAIHKVKEKNSLPAICGRVCPQEVQCESKCVLGIKGESVAIGYLERFSVSTTFPSVGVSCHATGLGEWVWAIRQPTVEPKPERRPMVDVILEISERLGLREKYYDALNEWIRRAYGGDLKPENQWDPNAPLKFESIMDTILRDRFGDDKGLEYFKQHGYLKWPKRVEEVYWRAFSDVRVPIYLEWIIRAGRKSRAIARTGISSDYTYLCSNKLANSWFMEEI